MKRILYTNENGGLSIVIPSPNFKGTIQELAKKDVPNDLSYEIVETDAIPTDRTFRNAWKKKTGGVETDMPKAKLIAHNMRRKAREELFKPLDIQATIPSQAQAAEVARQAIRDADAIKQTAIDNSSSEAELKAALESQ